MYATKRRYYVSVSIYLLITVTVILINSYYDYKPLCVLSQGRLNAGCLTWNSHKEYFAYLYISHVQREQMQKCKSLREAWERINSTRRQIIILHHVTL